VVARALQLFLREERRHDVTRRLDAVYGGPGRGALDRAWLAAGLEALRRVEWTDY
jgi:hypothetical protein